MNTLERYIYNKIRFSPRIKKTIVGLYQRLFSIVPIKKIQTDYNVIVREGYFFGFHDKCPWSLDNKFLLAHKYTNDLKMPTDGEKIEIGYFTGKDQSEFQSIAVTSTWNWQMGSMLQWLANTNNIIFNDYNGANHIAKVININGNLLEEYSKPIAAVSANGKYALSHSFIRLRKVAPAYGYANSDDKSASENVPKNDGIYLLNLKSNDSQLIFSIADIAKFNEGKYTQESYHYFTHCLFSPSGKRFAFYHRWLEKNNQTWTRLFTCKLNGSDIFKFDFSGVVTHLAWQDDKHLLVYGYKNNIGDHYYLLKDKTNNFKIIGKNIFTSDGHPQFAPDRENFITDTYPDRLRRQYLIRYNINSKKRDNLVILKSPLPYTGDVRCDLHPRWDRTGKSVAFDSSHTGKRALCTVRLK
ncbi:MAG: hypothetical protein GWP19_01120 [Planctomycetia bacterium]|nr:hypothetical protein [Planctomycetia bacterium]